MILRPRLASSRKPRPTQRSQLARQSKKRRTWRRKRLGPKLLVVDRNELGAGEMMVRS